MSRVAGITSNTVPWEILRAAGYAPKLLSFEPGPTPFADRYMEDVFDPRIRVIFDRLCAGAWKDLDLVVIPRTSEQEHKLFLYLLEAARSGFSASIPRIYFFDLLHTRTTEAYQYGLERTRRMMQDFSVPVDGLRDAIEESNRARATVRKTQDRRWHGLLEGSAAFELISGFYSENRTAYADRVSRCLQDPGEHVRADRPRILVKGVSLASTELHRCIEQAGGYVVAEDDWRGSRAGGDRDVAVDADPAVAIFEKYFQDETSPRVPRAERDAWLHEAIGSRSVDGVVFYIPVEDDVAGWDYPRQSAWLRQQNVPSLLVRDTSGGAAMKAFIEGISRN